MMRKITGYPLPTQIDGHPTRCIQLIVPDDPQYLQDLWGHLFALGKWYTWEHATTRTGDDRAKLAAEYWRGLLELSYQPYLNGDSCGTGGGMLVRVNPDNQCQLEQSTDNGETWELLYDATVCIQGTIKSGGPGRPGSAYIQQGDSITNITNIDAYYDGRTYYTFTGHAGGDSTAKCLASVNAVNVFAKLHAEVARQYGAATGTIGGTIIAAAIMIALDIPMGWLVFNDALSIGYMGIAMGDPTALNTTVQREFACILYNRATVTAGVVSFDHSGVIADVQTKRGAFPSGWDAIYGYLNIIGVDGLNIAGDTDEIQDPCCDFCSTTLQTTELYLTAANNYAGLIANKTAANNNTISPQPTGIQINANGNTLYGSFSWMFNVPPGCELVQLGFYVPTNGEPINSIVLQTNGLTTATWTNRRPFGVFTYAAATRMSGLIKLYWSAYNNNTTTGWFRCERVWAQYRGCDPFAAYR